MKIKSNERDAILQSLQAGLVPRIGLHLIQVGRVLEVKAILQDIERIEKGGSAFRFLIGRYGSGKSFFLNLIRTIALQKQFVVIQADISMDRRLYSTGGHSRALYSELMRNLSLKSKPEGGAIRNLCERWINNINFKVKTKGGNNEDVIMCIREDLKDLQDYVGGFEFAEVLAKYYEGYEKGDDNLQSAALRWLRAEYETKTEAHKDLGVRRIITDADFYDTLKLMTAFVKKAGYSGLFVNLDELVVLSHRLPNIKIRLSNYEAILTMLNDCLQGNISGIGFLLAGTDEFLEDKRRGIFSYEALKMRLTENRFAREGLVDFSGPIIRLQNLSPEDLYVLLQNIRNVHAYGEPEKYILPDEALIAVLKRANDILGAEYFKTPREVIRSFVQMINLLEQNPGTNWQRIISGDFIKKDTVPISAEAQILKEISVNKDSTNNGLETFTL